MTTPTYARTYPPAAPSRLTELESKLGARLPEPYRAYLSTQDGGALEGYNNHGLEIVTGIGDVPRWSSLWYLLSVDGDVIPAGWIPVGTDAGGGLFLLVVTGEDSGSVWYQSSELEEDDEGVTTPVVRERLADSWDQFLASIEPLEETSG
ncbi:SMI1/KNR4 family protein [Kribbella sp. NPDC048915]|uniref:SMI1/KNR4 family protein n=1 Tax=Kribbella sp. NPDC048915 TaxID=3155148 RepID=UPI0033CE0070